MPELHPLRLTFDLQNPGHLSRFRADFSAALNPIAMNTVFDDREYFIAVAHVLNTYMYYQPLLLESGSSRIEEHLANIGLHLTSKRDTKYV